MVVVQAMYRRIPYISSGLSFQTFLCCFLHSADNSINSPVSLAWRVALAVGGTVILVLVILVACLIWRLRRNRPLHVSETQQECSRNKPEKTRGIQDPLPDAGHPRTYMELQPAGQTYQSLDSPTGQPRDETYEEVQMSYVNVNLEEYEEVGSTIS